ncbi:class A beta-lactamase-related serine hydrolase [Nonomuraea mesophila]|uniref:Class A beta-lactamase-related serine hydrolase n=2 Tax=Nonomuraea mesophila TaxID=2530382 RepID=A0A4R5FID1_9ACTN|nr:class A beta-lactamase-related serine hydrolase [Nonomuraea mesophila]
MMAGTDLRRRLETLRRGHGVPGFVVGAYHAGRTSVAACGVANLGTRAEMTPDTAFLTGSVTKVWTTALVMTFVEEGRIDLDQRIVDYAPDVQFGADKTAAGAMTVRQLLNHSSGTDAGDYLVDTGPYPDGVDRYVDLLRHVGKLHEPGATASYNNAGWFVVEVILKRLTGKNFLQLLQERVIDRLQLERTSADARHAGMRHTAIGHFPAAQGHVPTTQFLLPETLAAAGSTLITTVGDTLRFLRAFLDPPDLMDQFLAPASVAAMRTPTVAEPPGPETGYCLGWRYTAHEGGLVYSHGGGSNGGTAFAVLSPRDHLAYIAFANSNASAALHADALDLFLPPERSPLRVSHRNHDAEALELSRCAGTYLRKSRRLTVTPHGERLRVRVEPVLEDLQGAEIYEKGAATEFDAVPDGPRSAVADMAGLFDGRTRLHFSQVDRTGRYQLVYLDGRLARRVEPAISGMDEND